MIIPVDPKQLGENLHVELAVLKILANGAAAVVSTDNLNKIVLQEAAKISNLLGGRLVSAQPKVPAQTTQQPHSKTATMPTTSTLSPTTGKPASPGRVAASKGGSNGSVIGGVVVAVVVVVAIIAFLVWYFR